MWASRASIGSPSGTAKIRARPEGRPSDAGRLGPCDARVCRIVCVPTPATFRCLAMSYPPIDEMPRSRARTQRARSPDGSGDRPSGGRPSPQCRRAASADESIRAARRGFAPVTRRAAVRRTPEARAGRDEAGRLCSPARVGGVDGGERGDTLRQPAGGLLHGVRQPHAPAVSAISNFRGTACSACTGAEPCAVPLHGEGPGNATGGRQLPGNSYLSLRPGTRRAAADACRRPRVGTACHSGLSLCAGPRHAPRMHAEGPGEWRERESFLGTATGARAGAEPCAGPLQGEGPGRAPHGEGLSATWKAWGEHSDLFAAVLIGLDRRTRLRCYRQEGTPAAVDSSTDRA